MSNFLPLGIRSLLEKTEWNPHEIVVYSALLEKGAMDLSRIAHETNIATSSVQYALGQLRERQLVTKFLMNGKPRWKAKAVQALLRWFKGHTQQFMMQEEAVRHFIDQYDFNPAVTTPIVEFREGMKSMKRALQEIAESCASKKMLVVALLHKELNAELLQYLQEACASLRAREVDVRMLVAGDAMITGADTCRLEAERMRDALHLSSGTSTILLLVDDTVYAMHCDQQGPCSALMRYPQLANLLRGMFECLWLGDGH